MTNKRYPHRVPAYEDDEGLALLRALSRKHDRPMAWVLRHAVRELAKREKVTGGGE